MLGTACCFNQFLVKKRTKREISGRFSGKDPYNRTTIFPKRNGFFMIDTSFFRIFRQKKSKRSQVGTHGGSGSWPWTLDDHDPIWHNGQIRIMIHGPHQTNFQDHDHGSYEFTWLGSCSWIMILWSISPQVFGLWLADRGVWYHDNIFWYEAWPNKKWFLSSLICLRSPLRISSASSPGVATRLVVS